MDYALIAIASYFIGSLPTAYILLKKFNNTDITQTGSGNVGAFNSFRVSNSKLIGITVFAIDLLKGMLAVYLSTILWEKDFLLMGTALIFVVSGHCFSPWISFRGGRGLASALGGTLLIAWPIVGIWGLFWTAGFLFKKHIGIANIMATALSIAIALTSAASLNKFAGYPAESSTDFALVFSVMLLIVLSKHYDSLKGYFRKEMNKEKGI